MKREGPSNNLLKLAKSLWGEGHDYQIFLRELENGTSARQAIIWTKPQPPSLPFSVETIENVSFANVVSDEARVGRHELHDKGYYYCLDFSSVLCASVLIAVSDDLRGGRVLDMCASPGGKAIFASVALRPAALVCNEVIKKRIRQLTANLTRCEIPNVEIASRDPSKFAEADEKFDLVLVDAPCSGQSLIARGEESQGCFHPATINMNSNRQKRILANALQAVRPGGYLAYMTCTYSEAENEAVVRWLMKKFPNATPVTANHLTRLQSKLADFPCYRVWPGRGDGAGGFCVLLKHG